MTDSFQNFESDKLVSLLQNGSLGVLPTDTLYGLVCAAKNKAAVERLYELKSREKKPGTIIAAGIDQLVELGLKRRYLKAVEGYWPDAVSIVIPTIDPSTAYLRQELLGLAVRVVADKKLIELLLHTGPLLTTSANLPGEKPADTIEEAREYFGDKVDFYVDGGSLKDRKPSTLIRIVDDAVEILREGAVTIRG
ncbi:MAG TPA: L-threonylcarbamoyladenylate synthase [Candidatus Saccharibacteria bacterium]|nr:L-threonylcarbamoyladenylate synthase [Candidatus Saccharibacteria bacterium]